MVRFYRGIKQTIIYKIGVHMLFTPIELRNMVIRVRMPLEKKRLVVMTESILLGGKAIKQVNLVLLTRKK